MTATPPAPSGPQRPRHLPAALWLSIALTLTLTGGLKTITGDALQMCDAARSLTRDLSLQVRSNQRSDVVQGSEGERYTKYPLLSVVGCVPALWLKSAGRALGGPESAAERWLLGVWPSALAATTALGLYLLALQLGLSMNASLLGAWLVVFSTPLWSYARTLYSENLQTTVTLWMLYLVLGAGARPSRRRLVATGLLFGVAINLKSLLVALAAAWLLDRWLRPRAERDLQRVLGYGALGVLPGALAFLLYNHARYGSPLALGYDLGRDGSIGFGTPLLSGLHGLLFSPGKSVFLYAPLLLLAVPGALRMSRERRRELCVLALPVLFTLLVAARWWAWSGDVAWGPRLLVPVLPLAFVPALFALPGPSRLRRGLFAALCALGLYVGFLGVAFRPFQYVAVAQEATRVTLGKSDAARIRDDLITLHYVPELSPLVGHHWLLSRALQGAGWDDSSDYPWRSLGIDAWRPRADPGPKYFNFWFHEPGSGALIALNLAALVASLFWFVRLYRMGGNALRQ